MGARLSPLPERVVARIESMLNAEPYRPWCVHALYESITEDPTEEHRDGLLEATEREADELVREGRARSQPISAVAIGVHCQDTLYWTIRSENYALEQFGPEYESPVILYRLASHIRCHGL